MMSPSMRGVRYSCETGGSKRVFWQRWARAERSYSMHSMARTLKTASVALRRNILRSALTCLGIIIGVAAVIAIAEIGQGSSAAIQKSIASMGANTLIILPGAAASGGMSWGSGSVMTLTPEDCKAILN